MWLKLHYVFCVTQPRPPCIPPAVLAKKKGMQAEMRAKKLVRLSLYLQMYGPRACLNVSVIVGEGYWTGNGRWLHTGPAEWVSLHCCCLIAWLIELVRLMCVMSSSQSCGIWRRTSGSMTSYLRSGLVKTSLTLLTQKSWRSAPQFRLDFQISSSELSLLCSYWLLQTVLETGHSWTRGRDERESWCLWQWKLWRRWGDETHQEDSWEVSHHDCSGWLVTLSYVVMLSLPSSFPWQVRGLSVTGW